MPKFQLIYYKTILNHVFIRFFNEYNDFFVKSDNCYLLSASFSKTKLTKILKNLIIDELKTVIKSYNILNPEYYIIIGACMPKNNILLQYKTANFSKKLEKILNSDLQLKYILKEEDIKLDFILFNDIILQIFNYFFISDKKIEKLFGKDYKNIIFITHNNLDCYAIFKSIKYLYGRSNCSNLFLEKYQNDRKVIIAINELIDIYVQNKVEMSKSDQFKHYLSEIKQFIDEKIKNCQNSK